MQEQRKNPVYVSYRRFSCKKQERGESLRRQKQLAPHEWPLQRNRGYPPMQTLDLEDKAVSGLHGLNRSDPDRYALAAFLELVKLGDRIPPGSSLIVESLDRLTRENVMEALTLCLNMISAGIRIVQLKPVETTYDKTANPMQIVMMIMELQRGHSESETKQGRLSDAWQEKKRRAREQKLPLGPNVPAWLVLREDKIERIEDRCEVLLRIFQWSIDGYGLSLIRSTFGEGRC